MRETRGAVRDLRVYAERSAGILAFASAAALYWLRRGCLAR